VVNQTSVFQIKFCGKSPALRVAAKRYGQELRPRNLLQTRKILIKINFMKQIIFLLTVILMSCNQNAQTKNNKMQNSENTNHSKELIDNDFLKFAENSKVDSLKTKLNSSFDIYDEENYKLAHIDAEELAEFSFDSFLPHLERILTKRGFQLTAKKTNENENSFDISINGKIIKLYTQEELDNNTFLDTAPRNFFRKTNELLKTKNCEEQFYLIYGGNDLHAILLTEKQFSIIEDYYKNNEKEKPYKP
jgi:hypothetical protein